MRGRRPQRVRRRAIIGVIALYALLLQAFLGFAAPVLAQAAAGEVLCAEHTGSAPADKATAPCHPCCTLLQVGTLAPPPLGAVAVVWRAAFAPVVWRPAASIPTTGPPVFATSARGPPAA
jgi:hypothetical protein